MNKKRGIVIGVLTLAVVMMVGYAIFSETLTISGTATAKGDFDMTISCEAGLSDVFSKTEEYAYGFFGGSRYTYNDNNYKNDACSVSDNTVTYSVELTQPNAERTFTIKITNSGTIDSILNFETGLSGETERCTGDIETDTISECTSEYDGNNMNELEVLGFERNDGVLTPYLYSNLDTENFSTYLNTDDSGDLNGIILSPGESMYLRATAIWDDYNTDSGFAKGNSAYYKDSIKVSFTFTQPTS